LLQAKPSDGVFVAFGRRDVTDGQSRWAPASAGVTAGVAAAGSGAMVALCRGRGESGRVEDLRSRAVA